MAWTRKRDSGRYQGLYRDRRGEIQTVGTFTQDAEALRQAAIKEDEQRRPGVARARAGRPLFGAWVDEWWPSRKVEPGTQGRDESRLRQHIRPYWDTTELAEIDRIGVQDWVDELVAQRDDEGKPRFAPATVHRIYTVFSAIMKGAMLAERITVSPCQSIELPPCPPADEYYMERDEFDRLVSQVPKQRDQVLLRVAAGTGMRWGELVALHRNRVHLEQLRTDVVEAFDRETGEIKPYPKGRRKRGVPIAAELAAELDSWFRAEPRERCKTPHRAIRGRRSQCTSGLVFPNRVGGVLAARNWRRDVWYPATSAAGCEVATPHDMRHTYASWLLQDGVSIEVLSKLLGHASVQTTERYAHLADTRWDAVRVALGGRNENAEVGAAMPSADSAAAHLLPEAEKAAGAKIIDLASRRRSAS